MYRIGFSEDIHPVDKNRDLVLAGIKIPAEFGLFGHSDADVICHAVAESILGALALGDLGSHFPDNDEKYKGISSLILLDKVVEMMENEGYQINNIDIQVALKAPKLSPYILKMRESIAKHLKTDLKNVSIKAMSFNKIGPIGNLEAIKSQSIVMLIKK